MSQSIKHMCSAGVRSQVGREPRATGMGHTPTRTTEFSALLQKRHYIGIQKLEMKNLKEARLHQYHMDGVLGCKVGL